MYNLFHTENNSQSFLSEVRYSLVRFLISCKLKSLPGHLKSKMCYEVLWSSLYAGIMPDDWSSYSGVKAISKMHLKTQRRYLLTGLFVFTVQVNQIYCNCSAVLTGKMVSNLDKFRSEQGILCFMRRLICSKEGSQQ